MRSTTCRHRADEGGVERSSEVRDERIARPGRWDVDRPRRWLDDGPEIGADAVALHERGIERRAPSVTETAVDDELDVDAFDERVAGFAVRREASLDPGGVEQHGQTRARRVPQLGIEGEEHVLELLAGVGAPEMHVLGRLTFAHRIGERDVEPQMVAGQGVRRRLHGDHACRVASGARRAVDRHLDEPVGIDPAALTDATSSGATRITYVVPGRNGNRGTKHTLAAVEEISAARRREPGAQLADGRTADALAGIDREPAPELVGAGAREVVARRPGEAFDA